MNNQNGNITLFGCLFLLMISCWSMVYIKKQVNLFSNIKKRLKVYLCVKDLNGNTRLHVKRMEQLNTALTAAHAAILLPNPVLAKAATYAVKGLKLALEAKHASYLKKLYELTSKGCYFNPTTYKTPFKNKIKLTRDLLGRAQLRGEKWESTILNTEVIIKTKFNHTDGQTKMKTQSWEIPKGLPSLKLP